jgi:serine/threonine protein kinase/tetratricopeptide (TPR) repeat protein
MGGGYALGRVLGSGGMGRVYEAVHESTGRRVALKLAGSAGDDRRLRRALLDEATAVARLRHPNIVALLDVGRDERNTPFLVMGYVEGHDLSAFIERWPGAAIVFDALGDALRALAAAHAAGVVHGDVKPENLLRDQRGVVKLTDFGTARIRDPMAGYTHDRIIAGTPWYMPPEQLGGRPLGPWTDLYAIGVVLYELLCGEVPWPGAEDLVGLTKEKQVRHEPFALVPRAGLGVPPALTALVGRLLDPDEHRRPRFAIDVLREIEALAPLVVDRVPPAASISIDEAARWTEHESGIVTMEARASSPPRDSEPDPVGFLAQLRTPDLVGREEETALVAELVAAVKRDGAPRLLLLTGGAGIGKSRIAAWGFEHCEATGAMERCAAGFDANGQEHRRGIRHALCQLFRAPSASRDELDRAWAWLAAHGPLGFEPDAMERFLLGKEYVARDEVVHLGSAALEAVARLRPVYLWLDDLGWSSDGTLDLLERVMRQARFPVLAVATLRSGTAEHPRIAQLARVLGGSERFLVREIGALAIAERRRLANAVLPLAPGVAETIARAVRDTPLVLVQFIHGLLADGSLVPGPDGFVARSGADLGWAAIERGSARVISGRLDRLLASFEERRDGAESFLVRAALLGDRFDESALRTAVRASGIELSVDEVLDRALLDGLLRARDGSYAFEHGLYREALLARLGERPDRREILRQIAAVLLEVSNDEHPEIASRIAAMMREAGDFVQAMNALRLGVNYCTGVGEIAKARELAELAERWMALAPDAGTDARIVFLHVVCWERYFVCDYAAAERHASELLALSEANGRPSDAAHAKYILAGVAFYTGDVERCEQLTEEMALVPGAEDDATLGPYIWFSRGCTLLSRERYADSIPCYERAYALSRRLDRRRQATIALGLVASLLANRDLPTAARHLAEARSLGEAQRDASMLAKVAVMEAWYAVFRGEIDAVRALLRPLHRAFAGNSWTETELALLRAIAAADLDSAARARAATRRFVRAFSRTPHVEVLSRLGMRRLVERLRARDLVADADTVSALEIHATARITEIDLRPAFD